MNKITTNSTRRRYGQMDDLANGNCSSVTGDWSGLSDDFTVHMVPNGGYADTQHDTNPHCSTPTTVVTKSV